MSDGPGMQTVRKHLNRTVCPDVERSCHRIAVELRGHINSYWAAMHGQVSARPGKKEQACREAKIDGMMLVLALALGLPPVGYQERIDVFLEEFKQERIGARSTIR